MTWWFYPVLLISIFVFYHLAVIAYHGIKSGMRQADELEQKFGQDIIGAFKYSVGGKGDDNRDVGERPGDQG